MAGRAVKGSGIRMSGGRGLIVTAVLLTALSPITSSSAAYQRPGETEIVSLSSDEAQGRECNSAPGQELLFCLSDWSTSISASGRYIAFSSPASDLVAADVNSQSDVFVRDRAKGTTEIVSVASDGSRAVGLPDPTQQAGVSFVSGDPSISENGRYVAFASVAPNLVPGDTNVGYDIFVHDRETKATDRVSVSSSGAQILIGGQGIPRAVNPSMSSNGRYVSFSSDAINLVEGDTNLAFDVFVHDRQKGLTERVSVATGGVESSTPCVPLCAQGEGLLESSISGNGRYVAFDSSRSDMVEDDNNGLRDIFVHDRKSDVTERVSVASDGSEANDLTVRVPPRPLAAWTGSFLACECPGTLNGRNISDDGRYVVFASTATNLVPVDTNAGDGLTFDDGLDVFIHDRRSHRTQRLSVAATGEENLSGTTIAETTNGVPSISRDGRYVVFESSGLLVPEPWAEPVDGVAFGVPGVVIHDTVTGATEFVSWMAAEDPAQRGGGLDRFNGNPDVSSGGRFISFANVEWYTTTNEDQNSEPDIFVRDRGSPLTADRRRNGPIPQDPSPPFRVCVTPEICIPPAGSTAAVDRLTDVPKVFARQGADISKASVAYRPQLADLFVALELAYLPSLDAAAIGETSTAGSPVLVHGLRFDVGPRSFEVRATSLAGGSFGLFDCTNLCMKVADLRGGYGTTGMRVVFSLPLADVGLGKGGELSGVVAFSGLASYLPGATKIFDRVALE